MSAFKLAVLPGDGIGPEVMDEVVSVIGLIEKMTDVKFELKEFRVGGCAIDAYGVPLRKEDLEEIKKCDAVLLGAVGGNKWDDLPYEVRPEAALLSLRKELNLYANLRPVKVFNSLISSSPLKREIIKGTDFIVLRELTGGIYYGEPRGMKEKEAFNTDRYSREEVERIARFAFSLARERKKKVTSVDKANVLEVYKFWRKIVKEVSEEYPDVALENLYVDNASMQIIRRPREFDVILCPNMFGDILSDEAGMLTGSIGLLPSCSIGDGRRGLYEPVHGSAPDIAGKGIANPLASILSLGMLFEFTLRMKKIAEWISLSVDEVLRRGLRTPDLKGGKRKVNTKEMGKAVREIMEKKYHKVFKEGYHEVL